MADVEGHQFTVEPPGGDRFDPARLDTHLWSQPVMGPVGGVVPSPQSGLLLTAANPGTSSQRDGAGVAVTHYDLRSPASPNMEQVFGSNMPSGIPSQPQCSIAPTFASPVRPRPAGQAYAPSPADAA